MATTPIYALPYPAESDSADVPRDIQALAQRVEAVLPGVGVPTGGGIDWFTATAPAGFLLCDGSAVSRITFAALFAAIGTLWGGGDGINTFNLPDTRGRVLVGVSPGGNAEVAQVGANDATAPASRRVRHAHVNGMTLPAHGHADNISFGDQGHVTPLTVVTEGSTYDGSFPYVLLANTRGPAGSLNSGVAYAQIVRTGGAVGNPTGYPAINGTIGIAGGTADGPSFVVVAKAIKT